jgi:transposase
MTHALRQGLYSPMLWHQCAANTRRRRLDGQRQQQGRSGRGAKVQQLHRAFGLLGTRLPQQFDREQHIVNYSAPGQKHRLPTRYPDGDGCVVDRNLSCGLVDLARNHDQPRALSAPLGPRMLTNVWAVRATHSGSPQGRHRVCAHFWCAKRARGRDGPHLSHAGAACCVAMAATIRCGVNGRSWIST